MSCTLRLHLGLSRAGRSTAARTSVWGKELDNGWLSAEGVISTGFTAIVILIAIQNRHLAGPVHKKVLFLVAFAAQRLTDYIAIVVRDVPIEFIQ